MSQIVTFGNKKLPATTMIFNLSSAADCISAKLGLCNVGDACYALQAEKMYKNVRLHRCRQAKFWNEHNSEQIAGYFLGQIYLNSKVSSIRFSESGDFNSQADVDKLYKVASIIYKTISVRSYVYTARSDLNYKPGDEALTVNGSGFMVDNEFTVRPIGENLKLHDFNAKCKGDCNQCSLCVHSHGLRILVEPHGIRKYKLSQRLTEAEEKI